MANKPPPRTAIIGAFEDIGENVASQIQSLPKDVGQIALESIGVSSGGKQTGSNHPTTAPGSAHEPASAWQQFDTTQDTQVKRDISRKALQELITPQAPKEESIWDKMMKEADQKKAAELEEQKNNQPVILPSSGARKVPGLKSSIKARQQGSEIGKNARQD